MEDLLQAAYGQHFSQAGHFSESKSENEAKNDVDGCSECLPKSDAGSDNDSTDEPLDNHQKPRILTPEKMGDNDK